MFLKTKRRSAKVRHCTPRGRHDMFSQKFCPVLSSFWGTLYTPKIGYWQRLVFNIQCKIFLF
ncbi:hypothetical protein KsCSTR_23530 [Candidatus Kuenenia stuttgartiensis]|uniref:Uncharacterized protein n=1 Tax=Kuenenia stuttgartiensis TaxID=174633 RepID=Q1Q3N5_KUEST|nr:hypothetical protein KsCSTR_23530 [Candidatus Kuenenia stuttgartiensis]CAJ74621.1 unknown protein [Candidatus Kuenenia stuttgartiensis]